MGEGFAGVDGGLVHELERDGDDAGADDRVDRLAGDLVGREGDQHGALALGGAQDADGDFGDHGEHALAAGQEAEPVEPAASRYSPPMSMISPSMVTTAEAE